MFGSNLPVCAIDFACLSELVQDGVNGFVFQDGQQLASQVRLAREVWSKKHAESRSIHEQFYFKI